MKRISTIVAVVLITLLSVSLFAESKAYLGVHLKDMSESDFKKAKIDDNYGILVKKVTEESPAKEAGIQVNDVIRKLAGDKVYTRDQVMKMMEIFKPEQNLKINLMRDGKKIDITAKLKEKKIPGMVKKAYMGVYLSTLSPKENEKKGYQEAYGILLDKVVEGGPAEKASLMSGDIIMAINGEKIYTQDQLTKMLDILQPQQKIKVKIFRDKKTNEYNVILGEKEIFNRKNNLLENVFFYKLNEPRKYIGVNLKELNDQLKKSFEVKNGVMIEEVNPETPAEKAGLIAGDIIIKIDKKLIETIEDIQKTIQTKEIEEMIDIEIKRNKSTKNIKVKIGEYAGNKVETGSFDFFFDEGNVKVLTDGIEAQVYNIQSALGGLSTITIESDSTTHKEIYLDEDFEFDFDGDFEFEIFDDSGEI